MCVSGGCVLNSVVGCLSFDILDYGFVITYLVFLSGLRFVCLGYDFGVCGYCLLNCFGWLLGGRMFSFFVLFADYRL